MTTAAILQPSYLSWPGHFYWMMNCDVFIFLDDVQFTRHDWRNRNYIKTPNGKQLLTVPVHWYGNSYCPINEVAIAKGQNWAKKHLNALRSAYGKAPYFKKYFPYFEEIFSKDWHLLSDFTIKTMKDLAGFLDIKPQFVISSELNIATENSTEKLVKLCQAVGADTYLAGHRGYENYIEHNLFRDAGIDIIVKDYSPIEYPQLWGDFIPHLSAVDLLLNCGPMSKSFIEDKAEDVNEKVKVGLKAISSDANGQECLTCNNITKLRNNEKISSPHIFCWKNEYDSCFLKRDVYAFSLLPSEKDVILKEFRTFENLPNGLIIGRIPIGNSQVLQNAVQAGFRILCPMVDLELSLNDHVVAECDKDIRIAAPSDHKEVMDIASKVFSITRFHREQTMCVLADEYHKIWAKNCLSGDQADIVLVYGENGVAGFISLVYNSHTKDVRIVLIGVLPEKEGSGVGKRLLNAGIKWAQKVNAVNLCVRTEADNDAALAFYLKNGFRLKELSVYLRKDNISKR